ncbi:amidohydrolase family protein [Salinibacter ruber]|uniref:amidohydrolase family protein n=1 Tax=Salinibacter ruber TaxID=146919 RepID=UPI000E596D26|nr:amidohydrolase family protein [Salinibacter ruber]MCS3636592.1 imidazolonepropionase-like amidohydrolase [Salinibacter ruber]MCS4097424.1 imidazolonepropionase-like amidohydrolase [Salinibacter ruber]MCS4141542.1 imidazolonepropionase-like amidohydrolase [Salinibacter ruber]MCS4146481.1 imidazolonepropionase-like amidohydrolase [Salinibacter ruber]MCS4178809.1 imidazolonepropionase-like amidohydrolase [Salinibacter ruber]
MLSPFRPRPQRVFAGLTLLVALLLALPAHAQKQPGFQGPFALTNAQVIVAPGDTLDDGTVVIRDDSIAAVGPDVSVPSDAQAFDLSGQMVYPGFIDSGTHLGLAEIGSLPETQDFNEIGDLTAHMNALTAVNPSTVHVPTTRVHGITSVITEPENGILPGTAALIGLHGYTPEQMHLGDVTLTKLNFPSVGRQGPSDDRSPETIQKEAEKALTQLNDLWGQAERYARIDSAVAEQPEARRQPEFVPAMEGLLPVIRGEQPLMISANAAADISKALDWAEERGVLDQLILSGALEGWRVADEIAAANVPVLVGSIMQPPSRESDRYDKAYRTPALLHDAGVTVALRSGKTENVRNLVFHAGFAAAHGLGKTEALRAITTTPARIFGVADQVGTIEAGKRANLFVADGDPLQPATDVQHLFIDGYKLPLENRATKLYDEFLNRNPGLTK